MAFLEKNDYRFSITLSVLDSLTGGEEEIVVEVSEEAVQEMKSYLCSRFDVETVFNQTGEDRNKTLMMYCKDIALYHFYSISTMMPIPEVRMNRYHKAIKWLEQVSEQKINPVGLPENGFSFVKGGGNEKRVNHQT